MTGINPSAIQGYATSIISLVNSILVPVLMSVAFIFFLYGIYKYFIQGAASETERETGRTFALYGIIGFVILFTVWGIVNIFMSTLNLTAQNAPPPPTIWGGSSVPTGSGRPLFQTGGSPVGGGYNVSATQAQSAYNNCMAQNNNVVSECMSAYSAYVQAVGGPSANTTGGAVPVPANTNGSCPDGYTNSTFAPEYCIANSNNSAGAGAALGGACTYSSDCSGNLVCNNNVCGEATTYNGCATGQIQDDNGFCISATPGSIPLGGACTKSTDCYSGYCSDGGACALAPDNSIQ